MIPLLHEPAVVPLAIGPLQALMAVLPAILVGLGTAFVALFKPSTFRILGKLLWRTKLSIFLGALVVVGLVMGYRSLFPEFEPEAAEADLGEAAWPLFRGNSARTGSLPGTESPLDGGLNWAAPDADNMFSSPTVLGNRVYGVSAVFGFFRNESALHAYDADSGRVIWRVRPPGMRATFSSLSIAEGYMAVGEGLHETKDARLFVYRFNGDEMPELHWIYQSDGHMESTPLIKDGRVYVGTSYAGWYCFELEPDANGEPVIVWNTGGADFVDSVTSPVLVDGKLIVTQGIQGQAVVALDAETGEEIWRVNKPAPVFTSATVVDGKVFAGYGHGNFILSAEEVIRARPERLRGQGRDEAYIEAHVAAMKTEGGVFALDLETGQVLWDVTLPRTVVSPVAATGDRLIVGCRDGVVRAFSFAGEELASWSSGGMIVTAPAVTETHAYVLVDGGFLYALDLEELQPEWSYIIGEAGVYTSSPVVARGQVYVGTPLSGLVSIGAPRDEEAVYAWDGPGGSGQRANRFADVSVGERGFLSWQTGSDEQVTGPVAISEQGLLIPVSGEDRQGVLGMTYEAQTRNPPREEFFVPTERPVVASPAVFGPHFWTVSGRPGEEGRALQAWSAETGEARWSRPVEPAASGHFRVDRHGIWIEKEAGKMYFLSHAGETNWRASTGTLSVAPLLTAEIVLVGTEAGEVLALDRVTGTILWRTPLDAAPRATPVVQGGSVLVLTGAGFSVLDLSDGTRQWQFAEEVEARDFLLQGGIVYFTSAAGEVMALSRADGALVARWDGGDPRFSPWATREGLFYLSQGRIMRRPPDSDRTQPWMQTGWLGDITAGPVLPSGDSFFWATSERGLIRAAARR